MVLLPASGGNDAAADVFDLGLFSHIG